MTAFQIDTKTPVMVTGATGYVAGWIIHDLLAEGVTVHGTVRDPNNSSKTKQNDAGGVWIFLPIIIGP